MIHHMQVAPITNGSRKVKYAEDIGITTARYILDQIRQNGPFKVDIPYAERIDYKLKRDYRGQDQFFDLIDALAILNYQQRDNEDGFIIAMIEDFEEARQIFNARKESHNTGLTPAETDLLRCMSQNHGCTQSDLVRLSDKSQSVISKRLASIMGKTAYVTKIKGPHGEDIYRLTDKVDFNIFDGDIVEELVPEEPKQTELTATAEEAAA